LVVQGREDDHGGKEVMYSGEKAPDFVPRKRKEEHRESYFVYHVDTRTTKGAGTTKLGSRPIPGGGGVARLLTEGNHSSLLIPGGGVPHRTPKRGGKEKGLDLRKTTKQGGEIKVKNRQKTYQTSGVIFHVIKGTGLWGDL